MRRTTLRTALAAAGLSAVLSVTAAGYAVPASAAPEGTAGADTTCSTTGAPEFAVDLTGSWRFHTGDDLAWAAPAADDSGWEDRVVPDDWGTTAESNYDGFAWYRKSFTLPERPAGLTDASVIASLGFVDDADTTYLNGVAIGSTGGFPPAFDSAWDEPREYYPPTGSLHWGGTNVLAVRMYDGTGGGGFYKGPVGIYSKASLREIRGVQTTPATQAQLAKACALLGGQAEALARGDRNDYVRTLDKGFFHDGDTPDRRSDVVRAWLRTYASVRLLDDQTEVVQDAQGRILIDTVRSWTGVTRKGQTTLLSPPTRQILYVDPHTGLELGNHSRFFRDSYASAAMQHTQNFDVYLPPSYTHTSKRRYPVVYMLHGFNGSNIEWEVREMDTVIDGLIAKGLGETIVIFPDASSSWYVNSSLGRYRDMIVDELLPLVDKEYRTIPDRDHRGISGVSMGGQGAFSLGLEHPELFSSIASHMGALNFPPYAGTPADIAANTKYTPLLMVDALTPEQLTQHTYYFDAGEQDDYGFDEAARAMDAKLTAKGVPHIWQIGEGRHADSYWLPKVGASFGLHDAQFRAHPYKQKHEASRVRGAQWPWP